MLFNLNENPDPLERTFCSFRQIQKTLAAQGSTSYNTILSFEATIMSKKFGFEATIFSYNQRKWYKVQGTRRRAQGKPHIETIFAVCLNSVPHKPLKHGPSRLGSLIGRMVLIFRD